MTNMRLDNKIKSATLDTALKFMLNNSKKSLDRNARNILELGCTLSGQRLPEKEAGALYEELYQMLSQGKQSLVKDWMIQQFHLFV